MATFYLAYGRGMFQLARQGATVASLRNYCMKDVKFLGPEFWFEVSGIAGETIIVNDDQTLQTLLATVEDLRIDVKSEKQLLPPRPRPHEPKHEPDPFPNGIMKR
jgi:hypothetical protein